MFILHVHLQRSLSQGMYIERHPPCLALEFPRHVKTCQELSRHVKTSQIIPTVHRRHAIIFDVFCTVCMT